MRTYLILKEKAERWNADPEIQALVAAVNADDGSMDPYLGAYSSDGRVGVERGRRSTAAPSRLVASRTRSSIS